jgi:integrase
LVNSRRGAKTALVRQVPTPIVPAARPPSPSTRSQRVSHRGLFLTREEIADIAAATTTDPDQLLVRVLAETGARVGEVLKLTPARLGQGYVVLPIEKRRQYAEKAVYLSPHSKLLHELMRYAIEHGLGRDDFFWPITRQHAHTLVTAAATIAGDDDAVFVRDQLGHRNIRETLHYAALSDAKRREKAARLRIAPETLE